MKTITVTIILITTLLFSMSCRKDTEDICDNLLEQGVADTLELKGEWELVYFAKTLNGKNIKEKEKNDGAYIEFDSNNSNDVILGIYGGNSLYFTYDLQYNNYITLQGGGGTLVSPPPEEAKLEDRLRDALKNTLCYVIRENELIIHYTKDENKRNILLLKRK